MRKNVFTTHDVAEFAHVTMVTVINWINDGSLKAFKTKGGHRRIRRDDLIEFLRTHNMPIPQGKSILIVDDEASIGAGLKRILEDAGYEVDLAQNGFEAGMLIEKIRPQIVILDLIMPGFDGFFVCEYLKKNTQFSHVKIVVLSGYPSPENIKRGIEMGIDRFLEKPIDRETLLREIKEITDPEGVLHGQAI